MELPSSTFMANPARRPKIPAQKQPDAPDFATTFSPVNDQDLVRAEAGASSREEYLEIHRQDYMESMCHQLWDHPQINWDGRLLGFCRNFWGDFGGNVFEDGLTEALNNEKINYARDMLRGKQPLRSDIPCATCNIHLQRKQSGNWLVRPRRR